MKDDGDKGRRQSQLEQDPRRRRLEAYRIEREPLDEILAVLKKTVQEIEEENEKQDNELVSMERSKGITKFYNALTDAQKYIRENYPKELWVKGEYYRNLKWIAEDERIERSLERTRFLEVAHYLDTHYLDRKSPQTSELAKGNKCRTIQKSGKAKGKQVERNYSLILVNSRFLDNASKELKLSTISIQKYIQRFCEIGLLKKLGRTGKDGKEQLYADGYWLEWQDGKFRKMRFLQSKPETRKALRNFRVS